MSKLKPIPRSRAKTAYGLVRAVIRAIRAEPKRADITTFYNRRHPEDGGPACGTVGCFAGWVCLLRDGRKGFDMRAMQILGEHMNYSIPGSQGHSVFNSGKGDACESTTPGTKAHSRAVIARIKKFIAVNENALRARRLRPVPAVSPHGLPQNNSLLL